MVVTILSSLTTMGSSIFETYYLAYYFLALLLSLKLLLPYSRNSEPGVLL